MHDIYIQIQIQILQNCLNHLFKGGGLCEEGKAGVGGVHMQTHLWDAKMKILVWKLFRVKIDSDSAHPPVQTAPPAKYYFSKKREKCQWTLIANIFCSSNICIAKYYFNKKRGKEEKWVSLELFLFNYFDFLIYFMLNILIGKYHCCSKIGIGSMEFGRKLFVVFLKLGRKPTCCVLGIWKKTYFLCFWNLEFGRKPTCCAASGNVATRRASLASLRIRRLRSKFSKLNWTLVQFKMF